MNTTKTVSTQKVIIKTQLPKLVAKVQISHLLKAINTVSKVVPSPKQVVQPIVLFLLLKATDEGLQVVGTNLRTGIVAKVKSHEFSQGQSVTAPMEKIKRWLELFESDQEVVIRKEVGEDNQEQVVLSSGTSGIAFYTISTEFFPGQPNLGEEKATIEIKADIFEKAFRKVSKFRGESSFHKKALEGVYISSQNGKLLLQASDSYIISRFQTSLNPDSQEFSVVIQPKGLNISKTGTLKIKDYPEVLVFETGNKDSFQYTYKFLEKFPEMLVNFDPQIDQLATVNAREFNNKVKVVNIVQKKESNKTLTLSTESEVLNLNSKLSQVKIEAEVQKSDRIKIDSVMLSKIASSFLKKDEVKIGVCDWSHKEINQTALRLFSAIGNDGMSYFLAEIKSRSDR